VSTTLAEALLAELDDAALDLLAERLAPRLAERLRPSSEADGWLNVEQSAAYLGCSPGRIYALRSAERIPYERDGSRLLFRRSALDAWIARGGGIRP